MKRGLYFLSVLTFLLVNACTDKKNAENTRCAQCGMPVEEFPAWRGKIAGPSAVKHYCSPRCLFINIRMQGLAQTDTVLVTDYYEQQLTDGRQAFYVIGSDIIGPMGHDLVPLSTRQAAEDFMREHQGKQILRFDQVTLETVKNLGK